MSRFKKVKKFSIHFACIGNVLKLYWGKECTGDTLLWYWGKECIGDTAMVSIWTVLNMKHLPIGLQLNGERGSWTLGVPRSVMTEKWLAVGLPHFPLGRDTDVECFQSPLCNRTSIYSLVLGTCLGHVVICQLQSGNMTWALILVTTKHKHGIYYTGPMIFIFIKPSYVTWDYCLRVCHQPLFP